MNKIDIYIATHGGEPYIRIESKRANVQGHVASLPALTREEALELAAEILRTVKHANHQVIDVIDRLAKAGFKPTVGR
jgi:hypothetical protein